VRSRGVKICCSALECSALECSALECSGVKEGGSAVEASREAGRV
jgi:hypothetical protein